MLALNGETLFCTVQTRWSLQVLDKKLINRQVFRRCLLLERRAFIALCPWNIYSLLSLYPLLA